MTERATRWTVATAWGLLAVAAAWRVAGALGDDAFITLRYAENLARGRGLVFNPGERVFGCTEPLLAVLAGGLAALLRVPLPILASALHAAALWGLAVVLLARPVSRAGAIDAVAGGTLVLGSSFLWANQGFAFAWVLLLLAAAARLARERPALAGVLGALAVGFRPDALAGLAILGMLRWRESRRFPRRLAIGAGVALAALAVGALLWFGRVLPTTLVAKQAHAEAMAGIVDRAGGGFWPAMMPIAQRHTGRAALWLLPLALAGAVLAWRRRDLATRTVLGHGAALALAYPLLDVPAWPWYVAPTWVAGLLGLGALLGAAGERLGRRPAAPPAREPGSERAAAEARDEPAPYGPQVWRIAAVFLAGLGIAALLAGHWWREHGEAQRIAVYREVGAWLARETAPNARVAAVEVGALGYYSDRPIDDLLGLVSPRFIPFVRAGELTQALAASGAEYVVLLAEGRMLGATQARWFRRRYVLATTVAAGDRNEARVFAARQGAAGAAPPPED